MLSNLVRSTRCMVNFRAKYCRPQIIANTSVYQSCLDSEQEGVFIAHAAARIAHSNKSPSIFALLYDVINEYDFKASLTDGIIIPLLDKIAAMEKKGSGFEKTYCYHSMHLFYVNILRYIQIQSPDDTYISGLLSNVLNRTDTRLKPSVEYYLRTLNEDI